MTAAHLGSAASNFVRSSVAAAGSIRQKLPLLRGEILSPDKVILLRATLADVTRFRAEGEGLVSRFTTVAARFTEAVNTAGAPRAETFDLAQAEVATTDALDAVTGFVALWRDAEAGLRSIEASLKSRDGL